jgi:uncharacterized protein (TIGR01732 family)
MKSSLVALGSNSNPSSYLNCIQSMEVKIMFFGGYGGGCGGYGYGGGGCGSSGSGFALIIVLFILLIIIGCVCWGGSGGC